MAEEEAEEAIQLNRRRMKSFAEGRHRNRRTTGEEINGQRHEIWRRKWRAGTEDCQNHRVENGESGAIAISCLHRAVKYHINSKYQLKATAAIETRRDGENEGSACIKGENGHQASAAGIIDGDVGISGHRLAGRNQCARRSAASSPRWHAFAGDGAAWHHCERA